MARNITVTFGDGTSHVYQNAPDELSPEQVQTRAEKEFGKTVQSLDGGRNSAPAKETTGLDEVGRQVGLTARAGIKGALSLPGMFADAASGIVNTGLDAVTGKGNGYRFPTTQAALDGVLDKVGLPQPKNATERVVQDITGAMTGAGASVGAGKLLQAGTGPVLNQLGEFLSAGPAMQTIAGASSAGAAGITREKGGGAVAQGVAGLVGAAAPGLGLAGASEGLRRTLRGGEAGRQRVNENIQLFQNAADTMPSVGQASESRASRAIESVLAKTPGGAGVMNRAAQGKADDVAASVNALADQLSPTGSAVNAGEAIASGVRGFKDGFKVVQQRLYDTLDKHIPTGTPVQVGNTEFTLKSLNEDISGAPNLSEWFKNSKIKGIDKALQADLEQAVKGNTLPYEAVKKLRTLVGNEISDNSLLSDVPRSKWTALYGALSEDLGIAAKQAGPEAEQSWQWANSYTKSQLTRLEQLSGIVSKDAPEKVFNAAMSGTAEGNTVLKRVVDAIPKENRKELASAVLRRMGKATAGNQNDIGDVFSTETFLTNLNKLSPDSRATLFGRLGLPETENKLAELAGLASNVREGSKVFANPSGTQPALSAQMTGGGALLALLTGHPGAAAATAATPIVANRLAKLMTDPKLVQWLGKSTKVSPSVGPAEVNALARMLGQTNQ